jgi:dimethylhistidine N-methyltransferase
MSATAVGDELRVVFAHDVRTGLSRNDQKEIPSKYLYDDLGSALFEAITHLDEYGITKADERLLELRAPQLRRHFDAPVMVAELGSGNGKKTRHVLVELGRHQPVVYHPIDVSDAALERCRQELGPLAELEAIHDHYLPGLRQAAISRPQGHAMLVLFLGSTIGNLDRQGSEQFLRQIRDCLQPGDGLLMGMDLVKDVTTMLTAYDDPVGVTAAFNKNLLARMNRELGARFPLPRFEHQARWNPVLRRIEMHLCSIDARTVAIPDAGFSVSLGAGESIWTEASHKYHREEPAEIAVRTGFRQVAQWVDEQWPFAENLWIAVQVR